MLIKKASIPFGKEKPACFEKIEMDQNQQED